MEITDRTLNRTTYFEKLAPKDVFKFRWKYFYANRKEDTAYDFTERIL